MRSCLLADVRPGTSGVEAEDAIARRAVVAQSEGPARHAAERGLAFSKKGDLPDFKTWKVWFILLDQRDHLLLNAIEVACSRTRDCVPLSPIRIACIMVAL